MLIVILACMGTSPSMPHSIFADASASAADTNDEGTSSGAASFSTGDVEDPRLRRRQQEMMQMET